MTEKKDIERLFQEKFKDFEAAPPAQAWGNIAMKLQSKKKKKRIIPFWFKISGIAAGLIIGYFTINNLIPFTQSDTTQIDIKKVPEYSNKVNESRDDKVVTDSKSVEKNRTSNQKTALVETEIDKESDLHNLNSPLDSNRTFLKSSNLNQSMVFSDKQNKKEKTAKYDIVKSQVENLSQKGQNQNLGIAIHLKESRTKKKKTLSVSSEQKNGLLGNKNNENLVQNKGEPLKDEPNENSNKRLSNSKEILAENKSIHSLQNSSDFLKNQDNLATENKKNSYLKEDKQVNPMYKNSVAAFPEVIIKDSVIVAFANENPLDKILKEKEEKEKIIVAEKMSKWTLRPNFAPLIISATEGSPISSEFADNVKDFERSASVGLGVDYAINSKFTIRTGINKFDLKYNTNEIAYYSDLNANSIRQNDLKTINRRPEAASMVIEDKKTRIETALEVQELAFQNKEEGFLNQQFGYIEVPVEVSYKVVDKRFGIKIITGFSTLFLNENKISVISSERATVIGEANNLKKMHFSSNLGLGFKYSFLKSFEANFEPTLKYQINTFSDNSGGFKPYLIGFYTGLSYRF